MCRHTPTCAIKYCIEKRIRKKGEERKNKENRRKREREEERKKGKGEERKRIKKTRNYEKHFAI